MRIIEKLLSLIKNFISLISKIEIKNLKIDSVVEDKEKGLLYLVLRINGKCTPPIKKMPYELLMENGGQTSSMLSKEDFYLLVQSMLENQKRLTKNKYEKIYTLISHRFTEAGEPFLVYRSIKDDGYHIKPAKEIFSDMALIHGFDSRDCACIGNIVGAHEAELELKAKRASARENNILNLVITP